MLRASVIRAPDKAAHRPGLTEAIRKERCGSDPTRRDGMAEVDDSIVLAACEAYWRETDDGDPRPLSFPMKMAIEAAVATLAEKSLRG